MGDWSDYSEMLNENVKKVLKESMWDLATCADNEPNVVPVAFKDVTDDGKLVVGDVFLETTLKNIRENGGKIAISAYSAENLEGYQIKGTASYVTEGEVVATFKAMVEKMFNGAATAKGAPVFIRAWRSLFWKITTHKFHSYYKKEGFSYMMKEKEVSALYQKKMEEDIRCPLEYGLSVFGGKWKSRIICVLAAKNGVTVPFL